MKGLIIAFAIVAYVYRELNGLRREYRFKALEDETEEYRTRELLFLISCIVFGIAEFVLLILLLVKL